MSSFLSTSDNPEADAFDFFITKRYKFGWWHGLVCGSQVDTARLGETSKKAQAVFTPGSGTFIGGKAETARDRIDMTGLAIWYKDVVIEVRPVIRFKDGDDDGNGLACNSAIADLDREGIFPDKVPAGTVTQHPAEEDRKAIDGLLDDTRARRALLIGELIVNDDGFP